MTNPLCDIPIDAMRLSIESGGQSHMAAGLLSVAMLTMLATGKPLPSDDRRSAKLLRADVRAYRRLLAECIECGSLVRLPSGEIWAPVVKDCRPSRTKRERSPRAAIASTTRSDVLSKTGGICAYCAVVLTLDSGEPTSYEPDHVLPVAKGGSDDIANLIPACHSCNQKKRAKTALVFLGGAA